MLRNSYLIFSGRFDILIVFYLLWDEAIRIIYFFKNSLSLTKIYEKDYDKARKYKRTKETHVWWGIIFGFLLFLRFIPFYSYSLSFYYFMFVILGKLECVK
jgi:hypothetical protein